LFSDLNNNNNTKSTTIHRRKKMLSQGGQKWLKKRLPRKTLNGANAVAASGVQDEIDTTTTTTNTHGLSPLVVQFTWGDCERRLSVFANVHDPLELISIDEGQEEEEEEGPAPVEVKLPQPTFRGIDEYDELLDPAPSMPNAYIRWMESSSGVPEEAVEYDVDEEDSAWLELFNK
jgi:hypothetical protein